MLEIVFSPTWFYGKDILIDIFSIIVLTLISTFSIKCYNLNKKNKNYLWLGISFTALATSFLFKILTNFTIYYNVISTKQIGQLTFSYATTKASNILFSIGFMAYIVLTLTAFIILYEIYKTKNSKQETAILIYLMAIITYFTTSKYFLFHLTCFIILSIITYTHFNNYHKNKKSKILTQSFSIIAMSQLIFIFVGLDKNFYVIAEMVQFIGYSLLLTTFIGVIKNAKKR